MLFSIIDDDEIFRISTRLLLKSLNKDYEILEFENGKEAIQFLAEAQEESPNKVPRVIFLDLNMPVMDGWGFLENYVKLNKPVKEKSEIIIVTSSVDDEDKRRAAELSAISDYWVKPVSREGLKNLIEECLNSN